MVINRVCSLEENPEPLEMLDLPVPKAAEREVLIKITACGVCHTELDEIEGRLPPPLFPVIPGHQIIGRVAETGSNAKKFEPGDRVGIAWIFSTCGVCRFCIEGRENLCPFFLATGRDVNGGYAEYAKVHEDFAFSIPENISDAEAAPLLCAGAIGYRSLRLANIKNGERLGLTGFGASAHIVIQLAAQLYPKSDIYVFARTEQERAFAKELGAIWAGKTEERPPFKLHGIIDTTPAWKPVVEGLNNLEKGGRLVINAIRKEEKDKDYLLKLDYSGHLWQEKEIKSVANLCRNDVSEFLKLAAKMPIKPEVQEFTLADANRALKELKEGRIRGAKVLIIR